MGELVCIEYEYIIQYSTLMKKLRQNEIEWTGRCDENFVENSRQFCQDHVKT